MAGNEKAPPEQGNFDAPERTRTSTAYTGHKALNLVSRVIVLSMASICRELSTGTDNLDAYGGAFGITLVSRRAAFRRVEVMCSSSSPSGSALSTAEFRYGDEDSGVLAYARTIAPAQILSEPRWLVRATFNYRRL
jgi:hypothetical protein